MGNRDNRGRFAGQNQVGVQGTATRRISSAEPQGYTDIAAGEKLAKPSRKEELVAELKREEEHALYQRDGEHLLNTIGPMYGAVQDQLSNELHRWFAHQGFWPEWWNPVEAAQVRYEGNDRSVTIPYSEYLRLKKMEKLGLIVTEVAEAMEAVRKDDFANEVEELADIDVRLHDYKGGFGMTNLQAPFDESAAQGFLHKMLRNFQRPFRHGKKF